MIVIKIILFGIVFPLLTGYGIISLIFYKKAVTLSLYELIATSLGLGFGLLTLYMFLLGVLGIPFSLFSISTLFIITLPLAIYQIILRKKNFFEKISYSLPRKGRIKAIIIIPLLLIIRNLFSSFFIVSTTPTYPDDAFRNRNFRGKVFYMTKSLNLDKADAKDKYNERLFNGGYINDYPMFNPLFKTYMGFVIGNYDDRMINIYAPIMNLIILCMIFGFLLRKYGLLSGLLFTAGYTLIPQPYIHSINTYSEIGMIAYITMIILVIVEYLEEKDKGYLILTGLLLLFPYRIKNEGLIIILTTFLAFFLIENNIIREHTKPKGSKFINIAIDGIQRKQIKNISLTYIPVMLQIIIWNAFLTIYNISTQGSSTEKLKGGFSIAYQGDGRKGMKQIVFSFGSYNIVPTIFIASILLFWKEINSKRSLLFLMLCVLIAFGIMFFFFVFTEKYKVSMTTGDTRQLMTVVVMAYIFLSVLYSNYFFNKNDG